MAPPIDRLSTQPPQTANRSPLYDTTRREAAQKVREAQDYQRQKTEDTDRARAQADAARERLQTAKTEEQRAAERVRAAKADEQQAVRASQQQLRGKAIDVVA
ncbi:MAG: hypothetical protein WCT30_09805 [Desulfurivibrionaceae bacterium]|jgi:hypothetical protein